MKPNMTQKTMGPAKSVSCKIVASVVLKGFSTDRVFSRMWLGFIPNSSRSGGSSSKFVSNSEPGGPGAGGVGTKYAGVAARKKKCQINY